MSGWLRKALSLRPEYSFGFYACDFLFRRLLRNNSGVPYPIHHTSTIRSPQRLTVGNETFPGDSPGVYIDANNGVFIGDYTNLGPNVGIISSNHDFYDNHQFVTAQPVRIGKFCWFGMGAVVLPGVKLGDYTMVGAGSIVTKSFEEGYCVLAGNPARIIRHLNRTECEAHARAKYAAQAAGA